ncbi:MAG: transcription antitermination factor NusB, partial [Armatimonadetes bacterium]|nr:transcription antitermination factor NusB [Armatimonadota bacterium]
MTTRRDARLRVMQALFQMEVGGQTPESALGHVLEGVEEDEARHFVQEMVHGAWNHVVDLDGVIESRARWQIDRLNRVDRTILRLALYEMLYREDIPAAVSINEAVELAREYGDEESPRFINGVLGAIAPAGENDKPNRETIMQESAATARRKRTARAAAEEAAEPDVKETPEAETPKRGRKKAAEVEAVAPPEKAARKTRKKSEAEEPQVEQQTLPEIPAQEPAPKKRGRKKAAEPAAEEPPAPEQPEAAPRRRGRKAAAPSPAVQGDTEGPGLLDDPHVSHVIDSIEPEEGPTTRAVRRFTQEEQARAGYQAPAPQPRADDDHDERDEVYRDDDRRERPETGKEGSRPTDTSYSSRSQRHEGHRQDRSRERSSSGGDRQDTREAGGRGYGRGQRGDRAWSSTSGGDRGHQRGY